MLQNSLKNMGTKCTQLCKSRKFLLCNPKVNIQRTIILPIALYGSLMLREECRLRVFQNGVPRRKFGPKRDKVTRKWRRLHNEA
jgi:hypothetical protein